MSAFGGKADISERGPDPLDLWVSELIPQRAAVLARIGAADQHAPLPVDVDRLPAAPRQSRQRHLVAARPQSFDARLRQGPLDPRPPAYENRARRADRRLPAPGVIDLLG